jgi:hypothetical protein
LSALWSVAPYSRQLVTWVYLRKDQSGDQSPQSKELPAAVALTVSIKIPEVFLT